MKNTSENRDIIAFIASLHGAVDELAAIGDQLPGDTRVVLGVWAGARPLVIASTADTDFQLRAGLRLLNENVGKLEGAE